MEAPNPANRTIFHLMHHHYLAVCILLHYHMYHILSPCTIFYVVCFNLYHIIVLYIIKQKTFEVTMNILGTRTKQKNSVTKAGKCIT